MPTIDLTGVATDARNLLIKGMARGYGRHRGTPVGDGLKALIDALGSGQDTPGVDISALTRRQVAGVVRIVDSCAAEIPNSYPLVRWARALEAEDAAALAANPWAHAGASPLRDL